MRKAILTLPPLTFTHTNPVFAAKLFVCPQQLIGSYGVPTIPHNAALIAQLEKAGMTTDVLASYDGFPFLIIHCYLRSKFNAKPELSSSQQPLFQVTNNISSNTRHLIAASVLMAKLLFTMQSPFYPLIKQNNHAPTPYCLNLL